jgi:hypothetical protein
MIERLPAISVIYLIVGTIPTSKSNGLRGAVERIPVA